MDKDLLSILVCPETRQPLHEADKGLIDKMNAAAETGSLTNRAGQKTSLKIESGLVREDGKYLYPVRDGIPIMLIEESISMEQI